MAQLAERQGREMMANFEASFKRGAGPDCTLVHDQSADPNTGTACVFFGLGYLSREFRFTGILPDLF